MAQVSPEDFAEARRRSLRRHAIETGIIERLYDVDWGVTEALVAEGLTVEVAEREGGIDEDALAIINSQFDALEFLSAAARQGRDLSVFFIRELHQAITRHQATYQARDALGRRVERPLRHGQWKLQPNHVELPDGTRLEYTPPEHVESEMGRLVELYDQTADLHPVVRSAWLHHGFIGIHPFEDGNGRVGRALSLLVLLQKDFAPLVVERDRREEYLAALDAANGGDLARLVRLFAELEIVALRSELERPAHAVTTGAGAVEVARAYADRVRDLRAATTQERAEAVASLGSRIHSRLRVHLEDLGEELRLAFSRADERAYASVAAAQPSEPEARYWYAQLIRTARAVDFYSNLAEGSWWTRLRLVALGQELRYVAALQKVGHGETGVLAITAFAELVPPQGDDDEPRPLPTQLISPTSADSVTLVHTETPDARWPEIAEFVERTLAAAVDEFGKVLA